MRFLFCLSVSALLSAQAPENVSAALKKLVRTGSLNLEVRAELEQSLQGEKTAPVVGRATADLRVERSDADLAAHWRPADLSAAQAEARAHDEDPAKPSPQRTLLAELDPARLDHLTRQEATLLALLEGAKATGQTEVQEGGRTLRCLEFIYAPRVPARIRRRVKEAGGHLKLWVDVSGLPIRSELHEHWSGRAGRIAPLEQGEHTVSTTYTVIQGALVAQDRRTEDHLDDYYLKSNTRLHVTLQP